MPFCFLFWGVDLTVSGPAGGLPGENGFSFFPSINQPLPGPFWPGSPGVQATQRGTVADGECASHPATGGVEFRAGCQPTTPPANHPMVSLKTTKPRPEQRGSFVTVARIALFLTNCTTALLAALQAMFLDIISEVSKKCIQILGRLDLKYHLIIFVL